MNFQKFVLLLVAIFFALSSPIAFAEETAGQTQETLTSTTVGGYVDSTINVQTDTQVGHPFRVWLRMFFHRCWFHRHGE
jgi:hypothetical protein